MEYKIVYDKEASKELENIYLYIRNTLLEENIAKKTVGNIISKIKEMEYFPFANRTINSRNKNRKLIVKNYIIIYNVDLESKIINILHIYNQKQYRWSKTRIFILAFLFYTTN